MPAPVAPPGRPLFLNRLQGSRHNQAGAGASAGRQKLLAAPRNARREKLASALLDVGPARDRKQREIVECRNLLRTQPRFVEQLAIVGNSPVRVQNERSQPSVTKFLDIAAIGECSRLVLSEQSRESAAADREIVVPADRAERRVLKYDGKMRIRMPVDGFQSGERVCHSPEGEGRKHSGSSRLLSLHSTSGVRRRSSASTRYLPAAQRW